MTVKKKEWVTKDRTIKILSACNFIQFASVMILIYYLTR